MKNHFFKFNLLLCLPSLIHFVSANNSGRINMINVGAFNTIKTDTVKLSTTSGEIYFKCSIDTMFEASLINASVNEEYLGFDSEKFSTLKKDTCILSLFIDSMGNLTKINMAKEAIVPEFNQLIENFASELSITYTNTRVYCGKDTPRKIDIPFILSVD